MPRTVTLWHRRWGVHVQIYKRGSVFWADLTDAQGRRIRQSLGTGDQVEAERRLAELAVRTKLPRSSPKASTRPVLLVRDLLLRWYQSKLIHTQKERSREVYALMQRRFSELWGDLPAEDFPVEHIEEYKKSALLAGMLPSSINQAIGHFIAALRWAQRMGIVEGIPRVERIKAPRSRVPKYLDAEQLRALLETCRKPRFERLEVVIRLSMNTGMRTGEIIWLDWRDVDLVNGWIHVTAKRGWSPKSNAERSIPISEEFAVWLKRHKERLAQRGPNDPVVPLTFESSQRWDRRLLTRRLTDLFCAAGVEVPGSRHRLHLIRGTFATLVLRNGGDLESLRDILGHSDLKTTAGYLAATAQSKRRAVAGLKLP